mgnify:CR=1 FL=1
MLPGKAFPSIVRTNWYFILGNLLGNASEVNIGDISEEFAPILIADEKIEYAFQIFRDKWIFTNKRLILLDIQNITGKKRGQIMYRRPMMTYRYH